MSESMKSTQDIVPELTFPVIDLSFMEEHIRAREDFEKGNNSMLQWIQDPKAQMVEILDSPFTRELRKLSSSAITGNNLLNAIEASDLLSWVLTEFSGTWHNVKYNGENKWEMLKYIWALILQDRDKNRKWFDPQYFQVLICIQDFYKKLPN